MFLVLVITAPAAAQRNQDITNCTGDNIATDVSIRACTSLIEGSDPKTNAFIPQTVHRSPRAT
jgi:hypothetical protein